MTIGDGEKSTSRLLFVLDNRKIPKLTAKCGFVSHQVEMQDTRSMTE